jgi:hypothetical protein
MGINSRRSNVVMKANNVGGFKKETRKTVGFAAKEKKESTGFQKKK